MMVPKAALVGLLGMLFPVYAGAVSVEEMRAPLLRGDFNDATTPASANSAPPVDVAATAYYRGLSAFARQDYPAAVTAFAVVTNGQQDKPIALRAAAMATLALSRNGDKANACQYAGIVLPLTGSLPPIWRVWVEEAQRHSGCAP